MSAEAAPADRDARRLLGLGAAGAALGIALSVLAVEQAGAVLTVASLLALVVGIHRFGRTGADMPTHAAERRRRDKR